MGRDRVLVSACLAGEPCRYDGRSRPDAEVMDMVARGDAVPMCAERLGGLPTPRPAAELVGGDGAAVLDGLASVRTVDGVDQTAAFVAGARSVAETAQQLGIRRAILQQLSPTCGCGSVYDGSHSGTVVGGDGILAAELKRRGVDVEPRRGARPVG